jgi:hypothetical protein
VHSLKSTAASDVSVASVLLPGMYCSEHLSELAAFVPLKQGAHCTNTASAKCIQAYVVHDILSKGCVERGVLLLCSARDVVAVLDCSASAVISCSSSNTQVHVPASTAHYKRLKAAPPAHCTDTTGTKTAHLQRHYTLVVHALCMPTRVT